VFDRRKVISMVCEGYIFLFRWSDFCTSAEFCRRLNARFILHKCGRSNVFARFPLLWQKVLRKRRDRFVQRYNINFLLLYYHERHKINQFHRATVIASATSDCYWDLSRGWSLAMGVNTSAPALSQQVCPGWSRELVSLNSQTALMGGSPLGVCACQAWSCSTVLFVCYKHTTQIKCIPKLVEETIDALRQVKAYESTILSGKL